MEGFQDQIFSFIHSNPMLANVLLAVGLFRVIFKPAFAIAQNFVKVTPSKSDDEALSKFMKSPVYKALAWFADYAASIKLPK